MESLNSSDAAVLNPVRKFADGRRAWFEAALRRNAGAFEILRLHSDKIDELIRGLCADMDPRIAVLALGGYGRREAGLGSDIDLLFLHSGAAGEGVRALTDAVLYPFWNCNIEAGGATRTLSDCRDVITSDIRALTAMTEARFICGNERLAGLLGELVRDYFSVLKHRRAYVRTKIKERQERLARYGDSIYLLEPNVKEGEGGLRDCHTLQWIAYAADCRDAGRHSSPVFKNDPKFEAAVEFMWRVRNAIHMIEGKRVDRLSDAIQESVAGIAGFAGGENSTAAEKFMSAYYKNAAVIAAQCERGIERMSRIADPPGLFSGTLSSWFGRAVKMDAAKFGGGPLEILSLFAFAKRKNAPLDVEAKEFIIENSPVVDADAMSCAAAGNLWREIFSSPKGLGRTLDEMQECGVLLSWFPEMAPMFYRVEHDGSHFYTAGVHSIRAVGEIEAMMEKSRHGAAQMARRVISRPHVLCLATFFHDLGKGRGGGHSEIGAKFSAEIMKRLGFAGQDIEDVSFLIRSHLLMAKIAFRRDVHDHALVERFAGTIRSPEILAMLYLLTIADLRSVGPGIMTDWKAGLLADLYLGTLAAIEAPGEFSGRQERALSKKLSEVKKFLGGGASEAELKAFAAALPERYTISTDAETIAAHFLLSREIATNLVATASRPVPQKNCTEFSVVTADRPGLFACIAGILTANGANITGAEVYTNAAGIAIDVFWVTSAIHGTLDDPELWKRIRGELSDVIAGGSGVDAVVSQRFKRRFLSWSSRRKPTQVVIDNDVSAADTVVEVSADDRRGLLYTIASALYNLGCTIERARITTLVDRVIDVFYVRDGSGQKIIAREAVEKIRQDLMEAIEE